MKHGMLKIGTLALIALAFSTSGLASVPTAEIGEIHASSVLIHQELAQTLQTEYASLFQELEIRMGLTLADVEELVAMAEKSRRTIHDKMMDGNTRF